MLANSCGWKLLKIWLMAAIYKYTLGKKHTPPSSSPAYTRFIALALRPVSLGLCVTERELVYSGGVNPSLLGYLIPECGAHLYKGFSALQAARPVATRTVKGLPTSPPSPSGRPFHFSLTTSHNRQKAAAFGNIV